MQIYRKKRRTPEQWYRVARKFIEGILKCCRLMLRPIPPTLLLVGIWYYGFWQNQLHLEGKDSEIGIMLWITFAGIVYAVFAVDTLSKAARKLEAADDAVDRLDIERFMHICDTEISPVTHGLLSMLALAVIFGFMVYDYQHVPSGIILVGGATYLTSIVFWVIVEYDDPCYGLWFIKSIPEHWLEQEPRVWCRRHRAILAKFTSPQFSDLVACPPWKPGHRARYRKAKREADKIAA